ncbi:MAG: hypothetical protein BWX71_02694 [Deltaproteobacteria bacterium ADurb.Bin072]|nr:MAG: hypothetical protein BWX71_02694 [Deltaproteobacteria bacterium ADurb.Bin072]
MSMSLGARMFPFVSTLPVSLPVRVFLPARVNSGASSVSANRAWALMSPVARSCCRFMRKFQAPSTVSVRSSSAKAKVMSSMGVSMNSISAAESLPARDGLLRRPCPVAWTKMVPRADSYSLIRSTFSMLIPGVPSENS